MRIWALSFLAAACAFGADRITATGKVTDADGKPVEHATVFVYEAGVKKGYSIYCPTCYPDCGKHAATDAEGNYTIEGLNGDLIFKLLVVHEGYTSLFVPKVDPSQGPVSPTALTTRVPPADPSQFVRGRVVDAHGDPVRDAVVEQQGISIQTERGVQNRFGGAQDWIDAIAVTNEKGEFEIAYSKPAVSMILNVEPRGMAAKLFTLPTGADRKTLTVTDGAIVLATHSRIAGNELPEMRIGSRDDGTFVITNVTAGRIYDVYTKMESLADRGIAADLVECQTSDDGQEIDLGDIA